MEIKSPKRLAIFDYCDTLFQGQSLQLFLEFLQQQPISPLWKRRLSGSLNRWIRHSGTYKRMALWPLAGVDQQSIAQAGKAFFEQRLWPNHHESMLASLKDHATQGDEVVIVSGGLTEYLQYLPTVLPVQRVVASRLEYGNNRCLGRLHMPECLGQAKVQYLQEAYDLNHYALDQSSAYGDSPSDIPLLDLVGNPVVVGKNTTPPNWLKKHYQYRQLPTV